MPRGVPEVPFDPNMSPQTRRFLVDLRQNVVEVISLLAAPPAPSNLKVTPQAFANLIQWTRASGGDFSEVLWSNTPSTANAVVVNVGDSAQWTDNVGNSGVKRYYWVRARKNTGVKSPEFGPVSGTTLASGVGVAPPDPPPAGQSQVTDQSTGRIVYEL